MTLPMPRDAFETRLPLRPAPAAQSASRNRTIGVLITLAAHAVVVAGLVFGLRVVAPHMAAKPIMADIVPSADKPMERPAPPPPTKLVTPTEITAPVPVIDIATPKTAIAAAPPKAQPQQAVAQAGEAKSDYLSRLLAHLNRFKRYPAAARSAHIEGTTMLHFVMSRDGRVLTCEIARSSGRPVLDAEALALVRRAEPLPPLPASFGDRLDAVVPIDFSLRD